MPKTKTSSIDDYRKTFQSLLGREINFLQWTRYSEEFFHTGLPLNTNNLKLFANFKKRCPRKTLDKTVLDALKSFQNIHRHKKSWLGFEIEKAIRKLNPKIQDWQVYRAFYRAGLNFKSTQYYEQKQVYDIIFFALVYGGSTNERTIQR